MAKKPKTKTSPADPKSNWNAIFAVMLIGMLFSGDSPVGGHMCPLQHVTIEGHFQVSVRAKPGLTFRDNRLLRRTARNPR